MHLSQALPAYPIFDDVHNSDKPKQSFKLNMSVTSSDESSEYFLEIAFGTSSAFLLVVIIALSIIIWLQKREIKRLCAFFRGQRPNEELEPIIRNNNANQSQNEEENFHDANGNEAQNVVINRNRVHLDQNINNVVDLIFPQVVANFRNITALREFQKNQRAALKEYQDNQMVIFQNNG
jgi:hypothetical protein